MAKNLIPEMAQELRTLLNKYGSLDHARSLARQYTRKAQENLTLFEPCAEKTYFQIITEELLARTH